MIKKTGISLALLALCTNLAACDFVLSKAYTCEASYNPDGHFHFSFDVRRGTAGVFSVGHGPHSREGNSWVRKARVYADEAIYIHDQKTLYWDEATRRSYPYFHVYNYTFNRKTKQLTLEDYREGFPDGIGKGDLERRRVRKFSCSPTLPLPGVPNT